MENESNQELLTWEECRKRIIELGKFEFKEGKWFSNQRNYYLVIKGNTELKNSILKYTESFPDDISFSERIYHILNNIHSYVRHYCLMCSKPLKFRNIHNGYPIYCGSKCSNSDPTKIKKCQDAYLEKTGYTSPAKNPEIMEKIKKTNVERYGCECGFSCKDIREKGKTTMLERYGVDNSSKLPDIKERRSKTYFERTGYYHSMQNPEAIEKQKKTLLERTGYDHPSKNPEVIHTREETCMKRFGVTNPFRSESVQKDIKKQRFERTGYEHHFSNPDVIQHIQSNRTRNGRVAYSKISQELFWMIYDTIPDELKKHTHFASLNRELGRYDWKEKTGYFYDFIISNIGLCIEFDGDYWHKDSQQRDYYKQRFLEKSEGYIFIRIKEGNFKDNKEDTYKNCIKIIKELSSYLD